MMRFLKNHPMDSKKILGVSIPFVLIPEFQYYCHYLIKFATKHNINLIPMAFGTN